MLRLVLFGTLLVSSFAWGAEQPTVAIVGIHQGELDAETQAEAVESLRAAIEADGRFHPLTLDELRLAMVGREEIVLADAFLGPGRRLMEDGRGLYEQALTEDAIPVLEQAVDTLRLAMSTANDASNLWEAYVYLGTARLQIEDEAGAREAFAQAVAINSARTPSAANFPPKVLETFESVREERLSQASVMTVLADGTDPTIYVNGLDKGGSPAVVQKSPPGPAFVLARDTEGNVAFQEVEVPVSDSLTLKLELAEPVLGSPAKSKFARARQTGDLYRAIGAAAEADLVLLAQAAEGSLQLQLYYPAGDSFSAPLDTSYEEGAYDEAAELVGGLIGMAGDDGALPPSSTVPNPIPMDVTSNKLLAKMLLSPAEFGEIVVDVTKRGKWLAIGALGTLGMVGVGTGVWFLVRPSGEEVADGTITIGPLE